MKKSIRLAVLVACASSVLIQCQILDNLSPAVNITAPSDGETVSAEITVQATATDNVRVARVEFYIDDELQHGSTASPYSWDWDTTTRADGEYEISAVAVDLAGNSARDADTVVTVDNSTADTDTTPPTVDVTSPSDGATVAGVETVVVAASDDVGIAEVEFLVDGTSVGTDTTAPYELAWDTTTVSNGSHALSAIAIDDAGNSATDNDTTVAVDNGTSKATWNNVNWGRFDWE
jgi:hypothetical protein